MVIITDFDILSLRFVVFFCNKMFVVLTKCVQQSIAIVTEVIMVCMFVITTIQLKTTRVNLHYSFLERSSKLKNDHSDIKNEDKPNPFFRTIHAESVSYQRRSF